MELGSMPAWSRDEPSITSSYDYDQRRVYIRISTDFVE